jgi:hypothetical protein
MVWETARRFVLLINFIPAGLGNHCHAVCIIGSRKEGRYVHIAKESIGHGKMASLTFHTVCETRPLYLKVLICLLKG